MNLDNKKMQTPCYLKFQRQAKSGRCVQNSGAYEILFLMAKAQKPSKGALLQIYNFRKIMNIKN